MLPQQQPIAAILRGGQQAAPLIENPENVPLVDGNIAPPPQAVAAWNTLPYALSPIGPFQDPITNGLRRRLPPLRGRMI